MSTLLKLAQKCIRNSKLPTPSVLMSRQASTQPTEDIRVTLNPGDGVGPELMQSVKEVFKAAGVPVQFEEHLVSEIQGRATPARMKALTDSVKKNKVALMGDIASPISDYGGELETVKVNLRKDLNLFANVVRVKSLKGVETRHNDLDIVVIREQTEGEYSALEHETVTGVIECLKIITKEKSEQIAKFAFDYATKHGRKKVTAVHKANIMKLGDGMFLQSCQEISKMYPQIEFQSMIVDNTCMQLVINPYQFDVMVMPNLYGNIIDNVAAGLVGGAGVVPGESFSHEYAVFETGARHPFAQAIGRDIANPTAMLLASANMLKHMRLDDYGNKIESAVKNVISDGKVLTSDMNGYSTNSEFTAAVIGALSVSD